MKYERTKYHNHERICVCIQEPIMKCHWCNCAGKKQGLDFRNRMNNYKKTIAEQIVEQQKLLAAYKSIKEDYPECAEKIKIEIEIKKILEKIKKLKENNQP